MPSDTVVLVLLVALVVGVVAVVCSPRYVRWDLAGDARLAGLPRRTDLRPWLARRRRTDAVVQAVGGCSGAAVAVWALLTRPGSLPDLPFVLPIGVAVGAAIGQAFTTVLATGVRTSLARKQAHPRVARLRSVTLADYLSWRERVPELVFTGSAVAAGALATVVLGARADILVVALVPALLALTGKVLARAVVQAPQPADDPVRLAWDDVLRVRDLTNVLALPSFTGLLGTVLIAAQLVATLPEGDVRVLLTGVAGAVLVLVYAVALVGTHRVVPYRRVRARLWDELDLDPTAGSRDRAHS